VKNVKKQELKAVSEIVKSVLNCIPETRNDDDLLYMHVINIQNPGIIGMTVVEFLTGRKEWGVSGFETVRRSRQKIQAEYPELSANTGCTEARKENEAEFREFARGAENG
jgi:hypothetical protein